MPEENIKINLLTKKNLFNFLVITIIFLLDRFSKIEIINSQAKENTIFINEFINFELLWNTGIGFGILSLNDSFFYHVITLIIFVVILLLVFFIIRSNNFDNFFYSLILGGALGNFYDRCVYYAVPDFIDLHIKEYHWFTFNIADIFISLGIILIILNEITMKKN